MPGDAGTPCIRVPVSDSYRATPATGDAADCAPLVVLIAPAMAQQPPQTRQGWDSRVHVYAPDHYVPQHGNSNTNPDFQLTRER
jgi:hypothetical protein